MSLKFRAFAVVGVLILALCGCQKGNTNASSGTQDMSETAKADSKDGQAGMKSGGTTENGGAKTAHHEKSKRTTKHESDKKADKREAERRAAKKEAEKRAEAKREAAEKAAKREAAGKKKARHEPVAMKSGTLTEIDNEREFHFRPGQVITVVLDSNRASGLTWNLVEPSGSVIVRDGNPVYAAKSGKAEGGTETWHFRASKPGHQLVRMEYRRKWASSVPERTFRFTGNVN
jgi:predicted secreted protein